MPNPLNPYDQQLLRNQAAINRRILKIYQDGIQTITIGISSINYKGKLFKLADYPQLKDKVDKLIKKMQAEINTTVVNGIKDSWDLSNKKNDVLVDKRLAGRKLRPNARQVLYDPNKKALNVFLQRKDKGLGLSERVWNLLDPFKKELEQGLGFGISKGQSAASMATQLKQYLVQPDKLFRRVKDEEGKLVLSAAARNYHPGQGVYRSSYKNALRVSRTETNGAYRSADNDRWAKLPFITGIRIKLSNAHPRYDICDKLVGLYPKDFHFSGWHPQCICFATPEQMSDEEYNKIEDQLLSGQPISVPASQFTKHPPAAFGKYLQDNKAALASAKNPPYWMRDNPQYVSSKTPSPVATPKPSTVLVKKDSLKPGGNAIGPQFNNIVPAIKTTVQNSLANIDTVHGDGILENIPFQQERRKVKPGIQAMFYSTPDGSPAKITLVKGVKNPEISIIHEMGHFFDLQAIGEKKVFNSTVKNSPVSKVLKVADESDNIKGLRKILEDGNFELHGETIPLDMQLESHIQYLLTPKEIWARSYTQFISKRSGSAAMKKGLDDFMELQKRIPHKYQWEGSDFDKIEEAIEEMMIELGWISPK